MDLSFYLKKTTFAPLLTYIIFSLKINQSKSWVEAIKEQSAAKYQEALLAKAVRKQLKQTCHQKLRKQLNCDG
jgi:hypothetical protein